MGVKAIADALTTNKTLKTLELRSKQYLISFITTNSLCVYVCLDNAIGDNGAAYVGELIKHNSTLTSLDLYSNCSLSKCEHH